MASYEVVDPEKLYRGKSYSTLVEDWFNWYLSVDADDRNFGPVVFLRSSGIPSVDKQNADRVPPELYVTNTYADDPYYDTSYANNPNVRVGGDKLQIRKDQAVFVPITVTYEVARKPFYDWGLLQESTGLTIDYGDNPPKPSQLTINGRDIESPLIKNQLDMRKFRVMTPVFTAIVPEADYGRSIKDFLEISVAPGQYAAIVEGYFVLIKNFKPAEDTYVIHCRASAPRERGGPYVAEFVYEISVEDRTEAISEGVFKKQPARNQAMIKRILAKKVAKGELTRNEVRDIIRKARL
jgi:hypothetical protein